MVLTLRLDLNREHLTAPRSRNLSLIREMGNCWNGGHLFVYSPPQCQKVQDETPFLWPLRTP